MWFRDEILRAQQTLYKYATKKNSDFFDILLIFLFYCSHQEHLCPGVETPCPYNLSNSVFFSCFFYMVDLGLNLVIIYGRLSDLAFLIDIIWAEAEGIFSKAAQPQAKAGWGVVPKQKSQVR